MNVIFEERTGQAGTRLGIATLDAPNSLNALSLTMIEALDQQLQRWEQAPDIVAVLLRGNGDKAFCAGGDVRRLAEASRAQPNEVPTLARRFFEAEYRLDHRLHAFTKPLLCWAHGHVLGGGMGLLQGANIRIVTPGSRLGMPEINIGLFPDVGGGWFLNHLPGKLGLFFALTASQMNAKDALELGLADHFLLDHQQEALINGMCQLNWQDQPALQLHSLLRSLSDGAQAALPAPQWLPRRAMITSLLDVADLPTAWKALLSLKEAGDPLLAKAGQTLAQGCPLTGHLIWQQLQRARRMSLAEVLRMEYTMSLNCCRHPEFPEGVRARLIDKDHAPRWHWPDVASVPQGVIDAHFQPVWEGEHPLADLA